MRFSELDKKAFAETGKSFPIIVIQEAGLDGFWIHRALQREGIESYVVDAVSIATSRRRRRAKTDRIDGEAFVRALLAYKRGEPRVCAMVRRRRLKMKTAAGSVASARRWLSSGSSTSTGSRDCCSPRGYPVTSRCAAIAANVSTNCRRAMVVRYHRI